MTEPLIVDGKKEAPAGKYLLVIDTSKLPLKLRLAYENYANNLPEAAYVTLQTRGLITLVYLASKIHDGAGMNITKEATSELLTYEGKRNIAPWPITAELVQPAVYKARDLPKNQPLVLAADYDVINLGRAAATLIKFEDGDFESSSESDGNLWIEMIDESFLLQKGIYVFLIERDGELFLQKWGKEEGEIKIDSNCELEVSIPEEPREPEEAGN